jgi:hypothetical protein
MSPRNEVFQAIPPFDASFDVNVPLIAAAGYAEEEDHRLEEKAFSRFKFSSLLIGMLVGFAFSQFFILGVDFLVYTIWGEDVATKSTTDTFVVSFLCSFFFFVVEFVILGFLRNLVATTYSASRGRSKELPEVIVLHMDFGFFVGTLVSIGLAWTMEAVLWATRAQIMPMYSLVTLLVGAFFWRKMIIKPSSSRRSGATILKNKDS